MIGECNTATSGHHLPLFPQQKLLVGVPHIGMWNCLVTGLGIFALSGQKSHLPTQVQPSKVTGTMLSLVLWRRDHPDLDCCLHMTELSCGDVGGVLLSMAPCPCVDILELCCVESAILRPTDQHSDLLTF